MIDFILGTWQCTPSDGFWYNQNAIESERLIAQAVRSGITGFDTAHDYGKGRTEQLLGKVLSRFPDRRLLVDTKVMPSSKDPLDLLRLSLSRLRIERANRFYLHWPRTGFDATSFICDMARCRDMGLANRIGICNAPLGYLQELVEGLGRKGVALDSLQIPASLLWTRGLGRTLSFCHDNGIEVLAYSPMGMGVLSGKYEKADDLEDARANLFCFKEPCKAAFAKLMAVIRKVAAQHDASCSQIALAWTASCGVDTVILGARSMEQLTSNVGALSMVLDEAERAELGNAADELAQSSLSVCDNIFSYKW